jgi:hypothetical protein
MFRDRRSTRPQCHIKSVTTSLVSAIAALAAGGATARSAFAGTATPPMVGTVETTNSSVLVKEGLSASWDHEYSGAAQVAVATDLAHSPLIAVRTTSSRSNRRRRNPSGLVERASAGIPAAEATVVPHDYAHHPPRSTPASDAPAEIGSGSHHMGSYW